MKDEHPPLAVQDAKTPADEGQWPLTSNSDEVPAREDKAPVLRDSDNVEQGQQQDADDDDNKTLVDIEIPSPRGETKSVLQSHTNDTPKQDDEQQTRDRVATGTSATDIDDGTPSGKGPSTPAPDFLTRQDATTINDNASSQPEAENTPREPPQPPPRPSTSVTASRILLITLCNGLAMALGRPRQYTSTHLQTLRTALLQDDFFNPFHNEIEVGLRRRRTQRLLFADLVVLLARLIRVMMRGRRVGGRDDDEYLERVQVRNACLDEPFFQREYSGRGFGGDPMEGEGEDEGCVM